MNILYFASTDFYSKPNPSFHLMYGMIDDVLKAGHGVYFIGKKNVGIDKHIPDEFLNSANFHYHLSAYNPPAKKDFAKRYLSGISYALKSRKYVKKFMSECEVVFVQSSPTILYNVLIARHYAKGRRIVMNVQDMFPGSSIASGIMPRKWMQNIFYSLQKIAYRKSDVIVGISEDMRDKIVAQGVPRAKTEVVLNWFDENNVRKIEWEENRFVKKYSMSADKFYVQYAGTMGYVFDYRIVLQVAEKLAEYSDIEFQMIGMGSQRDDFESKAKELGLKNIKFYPLEPVEMVSDVYSACSVCYIPLKHGIIGNSVPSKAGLLMKCKKPIITSADKSSKYSTEINGNHIGIACSDDDPTAVSESILRLRNNPSECEDMGRRGYEYGKELYSREYNMKKYFRIFGIEK